MKISRHTNNGIMPSSIGSAKYKTYDKVGIATGNFMAGPDIAGYRYHIDIGGGRGTIWTGTIEKLAMPDLLFHYITPPRIMSTIGSCRGGITCVCRLIYRNRRRSSIGQRATPNRPRG